MRVVVVAAAALLPVNGYFLGEQKGDIGFQKCWKNGEQMVKCPNGITMDWDLFDETPYIGGPFIEDAEKSVTLKFNWATTGVSYAVVRSNADSSIVPHINLHACRSEEGTCTPLVKANSNTVTHSPASKGETMGDYVSKIELKEGSWTLIAHGRTYLSDTTHYALQSSGCEASEELTDEPWKLDVVIGAKITVLPKPRALESVSSSLVSTSIAINGVLLLILAGLVGWTIMMRDHVVVKSAAPVTIVCCALGSLLITAGALVSGLLFDEEGIRCFMMPMVFCLGFWMTFGISAMKTWRINMIFLRSIELEQFEMSNMTLIGLSLSPFLMDLLVFVIWFAVDLPEMTRLPDPINDAVDSMQCAMQDQQVWTFLLTLPKILVLFHIAQIAYKVRDVPDNFNESKALMIGLASSTILFLVFFAFGVLMELPLDQQFMAATIGIPIAFMFNIAIVIGGKIMNIYITKDFENKDKNDILKFITNAKSKATGMSSMASGMDDSMVSDMEPSQMSALNEEGEDEELLALENELEALRKELAEKELAEKTA